VSLAVPFGHQRGVSEDLDEEYTPKEWARAQALGLDAEHTEKVAALLAQVRREVTKTWVDRLDHAVARQRELRLQRDEAEAQVARVAAVAQCPSYLHPESLVPRFVMRGSEVLRALKGDS
jgi:hypothetical protein